MRDGVNIPVRFGSVTTRTVIENDYAQLKNKPTIEGIILEGDITLPEIGIRSIQYRTEAEWNEQQTLLTTEGGLYIYSDHTKVIDPESGKVTLIPAIKIGDGVSYLSQLPFIGGGLSPEAETQIQVLETEVQNVQQAVNVHVADGEAHVSDDDRDGWNRKIQAKIDTENTENLVLF